MNTILKLFIIGGTCFLSLVSTVSQSSFPGQAMQRSSKILRAERILLKCTQNGNIASMYIRTGDIVQKGQVIASFNDTALYEELRSTGELLFHLKKRAASIRKELDYLAQYASIQEEMAHVRFLEATFALAEAEAAKCPRNHRLIRARTESGIAEARSRFEEAREDLKESQELIDRMKGLKQASIYLNRQIEDAQGWMDTLFVQARRLHVRAPVTGIVLDCKMTADKEVSLGDPLCILLNTTIFSS
ncbi:MAG: hypothetical protein ACOC0U_02865 [Desulfovibrionales bacterium]